MLVPLIPFVLVAVVIVIGNVTVLVVFTRTPALRKRKHFLLVSLALADLLVGMISVPMYVILSLVRHTRTIRVIYRIQDIIFGTASVFGLTAVAIERAYAVYFPFKHRTLWKGVYMIGIAVIWMMAAFIAFSPIYHDGQFTFRIFMLTAPIISSLAVIITSYSLIWIKMNCMTGVQGHANHERDNRLTVTLLIVAIISLIAWIPFQALNVYVQLCQKGCHLNIYIAFGTKLLHYSNSLVNPIIYALRMPQFKRVVFNTVRCCKQHRPAVQVPNEKPQPNRARMVALTTNYNNKTFTIDECQDPAVRDETQLNDNPSTAQVSSRDGIQINEKSLNHHTIDKDCYETKRKPDQEGSSLHGNNYNLHGNDGTYHTTVIHTPAPFSNDACRCAESTNEMKTLAVDNEGFIGTSQETKL